MALNWDEIYRNTPLADLHWNPGEPDELLQEAVASGWLGGETALDLGCGQGTDALYLASRGYRVTGLDLSAVACDIARRQAEERGLQGVSFLVGNALATPFADGSFDVVSDRGCFHHIALRDRDAYAREVARVLRPGGAYLYRNFCFRSQFRVSPAELLTEEAVRKVFAPYFRVERFGSTWAEACPGGPPLRCTGPS